MFRTSVTSGAKRVDRELKTIFGGRLMQTGDLNDGDPRPWTIDSKTLDQVVSLAQKTRAGLKARYTHPNMSSDGMGSYLGRWTNLSIEGDVIVGDLKLADAAFNSPQGDLGTYVMDMAEEDPEAFGVSLATLLDWDDYESFRESQYEKQKDARKRGETYQEEKWPMRFAAIRAGDVVDEPAATRGGFFSLTDVDNRNLPAQATTLLDAYFSDAEPEVVTARINGFLATYFRSKGHNMPSVTVAEAAEVEESSVSPSVSVDLAAERKAAADVARQEERERITNITALCKRAGKEELAAGFCEKGLSVHDVQTELFSVLCKQNVPVGDEGGADFDEKPDPDAKYKAEYKEASYSMSEADFVSLRRAEDGLEPFIK
jgi:hypothetical protein